MSVNRVKLYRRLGAFAGSALVAVSWLAAVSAQAIPIPADLHSDPVTAHEIQNLLTFPEGIPLGGVANFQAMPFLGEQLLGFTQLPKSEITQSSGMKSFPTLDPTVNLTTPVELQQILSAISAH